MKIRTEVKAGYYCHTVVKGDSLSTIAAKYYGKATTANVDKIYYANQTTIGPNKNKIYPGEVLVIP